MGGLTAQLAIGVSRDGRFYRPTRKIRLDPRTNLPRKRFSYPLGIKHLDSGDTNDEI